MKTILAFCISLLISNSAQAELSRKDRVSYTLDFYSEKPREIKKDKDVKIKELLEKIAIEKKEKTSSSGYFSKFKSHKRMQAENKQKKVDKATSMEKTKRKKPAGPKSAAKKNIAILSSEEREKRYGTKLSFSKALEKPNEKNIVIPKKEINEQKSGEVIEEKPNYIKGILKNTHPYMVAVGLADDNIYHIKGDETYDYITKLYPGFEFKTKTSPKKFDAYLNTGVEILRYAKNYQHNQESPFARGFLKYNLGKVGFGTFVSTRRYRSTPSDLEDNEIKEFIDYRRYDMSQSFKLNFNRLDIDLQYNRSLFGYEDEEFKSSNHVREVIALRNSVKIFPKTSLFLEYAHGWLTYLKSSRNNFKYDKPIVGLNGQILRKLSGTIKVGYNFNRRKTLKDLNGTVFSSLLTYKVSPRLSYDMKVVNGLGDINLINETITKYRGISLGCSYLPPFLKKLRINSNVGYWQRGSDPLSKKNHWQVSFRPGYKLKDWLMLELGYIFINKSSKAQDTDYRNNRIEFSVVSEF